MLLFAAGTETVAAIASCCLYKLAMNKDIQDKLRAETISTKTKCGGELNNAFLGDPHYAEMVINGNAYRYIRHRVHFTDIILRYF